jgi:hypothetical protein
MFEEQKFSLILFQESIYEENVENSINFNNPDIVQVERSFIKGFENKSQDYEFESTHQYTNNEKNNMNSENKSNGKEYQQENQEDYPLSVNQINEQVENLAINGLGFNGNDFVDHSNHHFTQTFNSCNENIFENDQMILDPYYPMENDQDRDRYRDQDQEEDLDHEKEEELEGDQKFLKKKKQRSETIYEGQVINVTQENNTTSTFTSENKTNCKEKKERFKKKNGFLLITPELNMRRMDAEVKFLKCRAFNDHFSDVMKKKFKNTKNQKKLDKDLKTVLSIFREYCTLNIKKEDNVERFYGKTIRQILLYFQSETFQSAEQLRRKIALEKKLIKEQNMPETKIKTEVIRKEEMLDFEFKKIDLVYLFANLPTDCQKLIDRKFESFFEELKTTHIKEVTDHIKKLKKENKNQQLIEYYSKFYKLLCNQKEEYYDIKKISENDKQKLAILDII